LKNKRVRSVGELLQSEVSLVVKEIERNLVEKLSGIKKRNDILNINDILVSFVITNHFKRFFNTNQLSQLMDGTNSLAEVSHKRKISCFGKGGINIKKANLKIREIHPSQFNKICPIETTEGKNAGLILTFAKEVSLDEDGFIETPFFVRLCFFF
jgi:DNA-directed RNA polymerase subunit beta